MKGNIAMKCFKSFRTFSDTLFANSHCLEHLALLVALDCIKKTLIWSRESIAPDLERLRRLVEVEERLQDSLQFVACSATVTGTLRF